MRALETDIKEWIVHWNDKPRPYVWVKTADQILASIARYCERISAQPRMPRITCLSTRAETLAETDLNRAAGTHDDRPVRHEDGSPSVRHFMSLVSRRTIQLCRSDRPQVTTILTAGSSRAASRKRR